MDALRRIRLDRALIAAGVLVVVAFVAVKLLAGGDEAPEPPPDRPPPAEQLRGFHYPAWFNDDDETIADRLDAVREAGGNVIRVPFAWPLYEPRPGEIDTEAIERFEALIDAAESREIEVIWLAGGSPCEYAEMPEEVLARCEATPDAHLEAEFITWPPADETAWKDSLKLVLERFGPRLLAAEIWNEPNSAEFLRTTQNSTQARAEAYLRIMQWTDEAFAEAGSDLPILAGSLAFADALFLQGLYLGGLAGTYDGIAIHPYSARPSEGNATTPPAAITFDNDRLNAYRSGIDAIEEVMDANGEGDMPIWITEFGAGACPIGGPLCAGSESRQAEWATDAFFVAGKNPRIAAVLMHELIDRDELEFGALREDGSRRPVFDSIRRAERLLDAGEPLGTMLMPGCRPAPFGPCVGRTPAEPEPISMAAPEPEHSYRVELACGAARDGVVDESGRLVRTEPGLEFEAGCATPWQPGGAPLDDGQQLLPADGPASGERTATFAFVAPGSSLMTSPEEGAAADEGLAGEARIVAIEAGQVLLRANTVDADVGLWTNALAEGERGTELVLGCERGSYVGGSDWPGVPESVCTTVSTLHMTAPGAPDRIAVPADRDVREVVWRVSCPGPCDPEGGPFAARIVLERVVVTVVETEPPSVEATFPDPGGARIEVADLVGVDRVEVALGDRRLAVRDSRSCEPSEGELLRTRVPCPADGDRRVGFDVELPADAQGEISVSAFDALGNEGSTAVELP